MPSIDLSDNMEKVYAMNKLYPARHVNSASANRLDRLDGSAWDSKTKRLCAYRRKSGKGNATLVGFKPQYFPSFHDFSRRSDPSIKGIPE